MIGRSRKPQFEGLENRSLLSANPTSAASHSEVGNDRSEEVRSQRAEPSVDRFESESPGNHDFEQQKESKAEAVPGGGKSASWSSNGNQANHGQNGLPSEDHRPANPGPGKPESTSPPEHAKAHWNAEATSRPDVPPGLLTPPGQQNEPPGQQNNPPGQQNNPPGQQNDPPGQQNDPPGQQNDPPGQQDNSPHNNTSDEGSENPGNGHSQSTANGDDDENEDNPHVPPGSAHSQGHGNGGHDDDVNDQESDSEIDDESDSEAPGSGSEETGDDETPSPPASSQGQGSDPTDDMGQTSGQTGNGNPEQSAQSQDPSSAAGSEVSSEQDSTLRLPSSRSAADKPSGAAASQNGEAEDNADPVAQDGSAAEGQTANGDVAVSVAGATSGELLAAGEVVSDDVLLDMPETAILLGPASLVAQLVGEALSAMGYEASPECCDLLTDALPVDLAALDLVIERFFDSLEEFAGSLGDWQTRDILALGSLAAGTAAVAAVAARRHLKRGGMIGLPFEVYADVFATA